MPAQLIAYFKHPVSIKSRPPEKRQKGTRSAAPDLSVLANRTRHDFSLYKKAPWCGALNGA
jgi:hypothetical protein